MKQRIRMLLTLTALLCAVFACSVTASAVDTACSGHQLTWHEGSQQQVCTNSAGEIHTWCPQNFPDQNFRKLVNNKCGNYLTDETLKLLSSLSLTGSSSLKGVELLNELGQLTIKNTTAESLNLRGLKNLESLKIESRNLAVLDLTGLTELRVLELISTYDLEKLTFTTLPKLYSASIVFWVNENPEDRTLDLSSLKLKTLNLTTNMTVKLGSQPNLTDLTVNAYRFTGDALDLSGSQYLKSVHLAYSELDVLDLSNCPKLQSVTTEDVERIDSVSVYNCARLKELNLNGCSTRELDIRGATDLENLQAGGCPFSWAATAPVSGRSNEFLYGNNSSLRELRLRENSIQSLNLGVFPNLEDVILWDMAELASLDLSGSTKLRELRLGSSPKLTTLDCSNCPELRIICANDNTALRELNLNGAHLLETLQIGNTAIQKLDLSDCWSIEDVLCAGRSYSTAKGTLINPTGFPNGEVIFEGWTLDVYGATEVSSDLQNFAHYQCAEKSNLITVNFHGTTKTFTYHTAYAMPAIGLTTTDFIGWSLTEGGTEVAYAEDDLIIPEGDMDLYAVYAKYCEIRYEVLTASATQTSISSGYLLPYGADTYQFQLGQDANGNLEEVPEVAGRVHTGWKVYDLDGPTPETPVTYGIDEKVDLHGSARIEATYDVILSHAQVELPAAKIDGTPTEAKTETKGVTLTTSWYQFVGISPIKKLDADSVFVSGQKYRCYMQLDAKDGYRFGENFALSTPGMAVEYSTSNKDTKIVYVDFEPKSPYLHLLNFIVPVAGMQADEVADYDIGSTYPCIRTGFRWLDADKNAFTGAFVAGSTYYAEVTLDTRIGTFPEDLDVKVQKNNGSTNLIVDNCQINEKRCTILVKCMVPRYLVEMTVALPAADSTGSAGVAYTIDGADTSYRVISSSWKKFHDGSDHYGMIYPGEIYTAHFVFEVSSAGSTGFLINGQVPVVNPVTTRQVNVSINLEAHMKIKVNFNPGEGSGVMDGTVLASGIRYYLPDCQFTAPEGKMFDCWSINGSDYLVGSSVIITEDTEVLAKWVDIPPVSVDASLSGGTVSVTAENLKPGSRQLVCAVQYGSDGLIKAIKTAEMNPETPACEMSGFSVKSGDTFKVFLLNAKTCAPLCQPTAF